jgi:hypothetical protein
MTISGSSFKGYRGGGHTSPGGFQVWELKLIVESVILDGGFNLG